ncbi:16977_t:CDS:1, partial [Acaulospora colombiana]
LTPAHTRRNIDIMDTNLHSYAGFELTEEPLLFSDPNNSTENSHFSVRLSVYKGIPTEGSQPDGKTFVPIGPVLTDRWMEAKLVDKYLDPNYRKEEYDRATKPGNTSQFKPFHLWDQSGALLETFPGDNKLFVDPSGKTEKEWDEEQEAKWKNIIVSMQQAKSKLPWSVYLRFHQPSANTKVKLVFTPTEVPSKFSVDQLKQVFKDHVKTPENIDVEFKSWAEAVQLHQKGELFL